MTWTGWKYVEFAVPPGVSYPLKLRRFYVAETKADQKYTDDILIDGLVAKVPPSVTLPPAQKVADPDRQAPRPRAEPWRFAVMSDAQFVARDPDSDIVAHARRTLREIKAAQAGLPARSTVTWWTRASPGRLRLAKQVLDEELGGTLPCHYVPGQPRGDGRQDRQLQGRIRRQRTGRSTTRARGSSRSTPRA